jgi:two-component system response regulator NreC
MCTAVPPAKLPTMAEQLSPREREVLQLLALGHTNREVGERLFISVRTVESHRASIQRKLGARSRAELTRHALTYGLLEPD